MKKCFKYFSLFIILNLILIPSVFAGCKCDDGFILDGTECVKTYNGTTSSGYSINVTCDPGDKLVIPHVGPCEKRVAATCNDNIPSGNDINLNDYTYVGKSADGIRCPNNTILLSDGNCYEKKTKTTTTTTTKMAPTKDTQSHSNCPLGEHVTKDLYGILNILKIVAPILCFAMSVYDLIVSLTKDAEVESKKVAKRFGKRLIYVALLFFVPVLIDALMQYLNVWNENGTCSLAEGVKSSEQSDYSCYKCGNEYMWKTNSSAKKVCGEGKVLTELPLINQQSCNGSANVKACYVCRSTNNSYFGTLKDAYNNLRCDPRGLSNEDTNKCN